MIYNGTLNTVPLNAIPLNDYRNVYNSCRIYIVLFVIFLIISIIISSVFIYFHWYLKRDNIYVTFNANTQTTINRMPFH